MNEAGEIYEISVRSILRVFKNPMTTHVWGERPFTARDVKKFIQENRLEARVWDGSPSDKNTMRHVEEPDKRDFHIARIAYMVVNPQNHPICLEIACPEIGMYDNHLEDGNHRFAAALVRGDKKILVTFGGGVEEFHRMFRGSRRVSH